MTDSHAALRAALGEPAPVAPLPTARSPAWAAAAALLREALARHGAPGRVRSPDALWRLLRGTERPRGATWGGLLAGRGLDDLVDAMAGRGTEGEVRLASWNVRWLVAPHTARNAAKREVLRRLLEAGRVVLVQETHWTAADAAVWHARFPAAHLRHSEATEGPRGGPQGGVAVLVPQALTVLSNRVLVPGRAIEVTVRLESGPARFLSVYLPPTDREGTRRALVEARGEPDGSRLYAATCS